MKAVCGRASYAGRGMDDCRGHAPSLRTPVNRGTAPCHVARGQRSLSPILLSRILPMKGYSAVFIAFLFCIMPLMVRDTYSADFPRVAAQEERGGSTNDGDASKRYRWLFREPEKVHTPSEPESLALLDKLDMEIKQARKLYLSGEIDNAVLKYRSAIDHLESIVDDIPPGNSLVRKVAERLSVYDELATKILGPVHLEPQEATASSIFHLMEKRRICLRNLTLKSAGVVNFFDVPGTLAEQEAKILRSLMETRTSPPSNETRRQEESLKDQLAQVRKTLRQSSSRYALLRGGDPVTLDEIRGEILKPQEMILDFALLQDRLVVGIITAEKGVYYQLPVNRGDIDKAVFGLQEKLREFTYGGRSTFMGHAWKEPCRRIYRTLFGKLPPLPRDKTTVLVIPDRSLWYLPLSALLDAEDRPLGYDRMISVIASGDMIKMARSNAQELQSANYSTDLLMFESIPWIPEEQIVKRPPQGKQARRTSESDRIQELILANPVYPKPTEILPSIQRIFEKFEVWVGPTATVDHLLAPSGRVRNVTLLAVPLAVPDTVRPDKQPCFFFSPDKKGRRRLEVSRLFSDPIRSRFTLMPIAWFDPVEGESQMGEGPLLLHLALIYSGTQMGVINYSDPNWGAEDPCLASVLKRAVEHASPGEALMSCSRDLPAGLDASFSGKPPSWTGWICMGDPGM